MTILHLCFEDSWRGGEQQVAYLHEGLIEAGILSVIACKLGSGMEEYCIINKIPHQAFAIRSNIDFSSAIAIKKYTNILNADLVHIHSSKGHTLAVIASYLGLSTPLILSRRVDFPLKSNWFSKLKYRHKQIKRILCVSDFISSIVKKVIKPEIVQTIHSGVNLDRFADMNPILLKETFDIPESSILVGNTSAVADHKDYETFVDTANLVINEMDNIYFVIVGDGPEFDNIKSYIEEKKLSNRILMTGHVQSVGSYLLRMDYFLFTSKKEGLGTSVLDAMANGVPIVATIAGGVPEIIQDGVNGLLAPIKDPESISEKLLELINNDQSKTRLIDQGLKDVEKFTADRMISKTIAVYEDVLSG